MIAKVSYKELCRVLGRHFGGSFEKSMIMFTADCEKVYFSHENYQMIFACEKMSNDDKQDFIKKYKNFGLEITELTI